MRVKMSKQPPPAPTASAEGPCPTLIQTSRTPRHWKFTQDHCATRPPPFQCEPFLLIKEVEPKLQLFSMFSCRSTLLIKSFDVCLKSIKHNRSVWGVRLSLVLYFIQNVSANADRLFPICNHYRKLRVLNPLHFLRVFNSLTTEKQTTKFSSANFQKNLKLYHTVNSKTRGQKV